MNKLDIVLIKPGSQRQLYGDLSDFNLTAIEPPLWAALMAGYLRKMGYSAVLYDAEAENWSYEEAARQAVAADPLLVAVVVSGSNPSASTMNMGGAGQIVSFIKQSAPQIKTLLSGLHPSALPAETLREEKPDFVCQGEGFFTLPLLIDALKADASDYRIKGLWYTKDNQVVSNPRPPLMKNLDKVPMPAWDLLPMEKYRAHNWHCFDHITKRQPYGILYTSLGCPFNCTFCCINALFGKHMIRYRSLNKVIEELEFLVGTYGIKDIKIIDEMFALNEKRIVSLCDMIIARGFDLNIWAYARVNTVTEKMLTKMKQAGINWVAYGFESGSRRVIEDVTKGYTVDMVAKVVEMTYAEGLHICANYIFGLPEDDYDSMHETLKLMLDINAEWANIYCTMAYPGSKLYDLAIQNSWQLPETWEGYSQYAYESLPLSTKYLSGGQVLAFRDYAFQAYFQNPRYLNMIAAKFGEKTVSAICEMTNGSLKRKHLVRS
ncbi:radical SAM domain protein [delta proteobacterium NaphS2]|nr:radical SAM domain protein [delta proteobacterium NaphS2]